ncbi:B3 domain-containing protein REM3-like [Olea europaea var. sylvestris]|uniref:B3 domain-containing protein REM3-like n=1 Tax=Olea europaea var. sylvestris TaxID=158386 RepID=UPI000C1D5A01|nr:B3 domain-containing protein REM3-like [Olea europaea var. sylvestris]
MGEMNFNAFVFDFTACEKEFDRNLGAIKINSGASFQQRNNPYFVITIKQHNSPGSRAQYVRIPAKFWKSNGLNEKTSVNLRDPSGKKWPVELKFDKNGTSYHRLIMLRGWKQFYESNKLKNGNVCTFELNHNPEGSTVASMDVHIERAPN